MRVVVGADSSTQSVKVEARDIETGEIVGAAAAPHPPTTPPVSEHDPATWWDAFTTAMAKIDESVRRSTVSVSVAGQQHGLVVVDDGGIPVRPAKLWNDTTSADQSGRLIAAIGAKEWARRTGSVPVAAFTITKLAWLADNEPEALARSTAVMLPHDYLTGLLCGRHVTDRGDASGTGWYSPANAQYDRDLIDIAAPGWEGRLPEVLGPREPAGTVTPQAAKRLGIPPTALVAPGTGDNMAAALGLGLRPGDVVVSLGTSGTVFAESLTPTADEHGEVAGFCSATGHFLPLVCTLNATKVTDTVARWLGTDPAGLAALAIDAISDPGDVIAVPYFDGERTPNLPHATGTLAGLRTSTTRQQIALAAHDGVICGLLDGLDALNASGAGTDGQLLLVGGGRRSAAYPRRLADLSGRSVRVPDVDEAVAAGAAVQAAMVVDDVDLATIADRWGLGSGTSVDPGCDARDRRELYSSVRPIR